MHLRRPDARHRSHAADPALVRSAQRLDGASLKHERDDALARPETAIGRAAESICTELAARNCDVVRALSFDDGEAIVGYDALLGAVIVNWHLGAHAKTAHNEAPALLKRLRERQPNAPVFMTADRKLVKGTMTIEVAEMVDEFVWLLEDTADFVSGRVMAAIERYRAQLLPPYARALAVYSQLREHSWSAPGHQGGIAHHMDAGLQGRFEADRLDRAPAGAVGHAGLRGDRGSALRWHDVGDRGLVVFEIGLHGQCRRIDRGDAAALAERHPFDQAGIELLPRRLELPLLRERILGIEDQHLGARLGFLEVVRDQAGALVGRRGQRSGFSGSTMPTTPPSSIASSWRRSSMICSPPPFQACGIFSDAAWS